MPHAIPQTHSASYPHRSMWTKCPVKFLVPRRLGNFHFSFLFSHDIEKQIWILLFVFRFRLTLKNAFELRFSFSHHFEKRIWISFLYGLLFEKQIWISFVVIARLLKNGLLHQSFEVPGHPLGVYRGIHFLCKGKQLNFLLPGAKVSGELPRPHDMSPTHGTPF